MRVGVCVTENPDDKVLALYRQTDDMQTTEGNFILGWVSVIPMEVVDLIDRRGIQPTL